MRQQEKAARERLGHALKILEAHVVAVRSHVEADLPTAGVRDNIVTAALSVCVQLAIVDAFRNDREGR